MNSDLFIVLGSVFTLCTLREQCFLSEGARRRNEEGCSCVRRFNLKTLKLVQQRVQPVTDSCVAVTSCVSGVICDSARVYNRAGEISEKVTMRKDQPSNCTELAGVSLTPAWSGQRRHKLRLLKLGSTAVMLPPIPHPHPAGKSQAESSAEHSPVALLPSTMQLCTSSLPLKVYSLDEECRYLASFLPYLSPFPVTLIREVGCSPDKSPGHPRDNKQITEAN